MSLSTMQVFEYLLALKNITVPVVRDILDYDDKYWWQAELPQGDGCLLYGTTKDADAWLEVYKQVISPAPQAPQAIREWIKLPGTEPGCLPQVYDQLSRLPDSGADVTGKMTAFDAEPERVALFDKWLSEVWEPWSKAALCQQRVQKLYGELFALYQRLQREGEATELAWGHGLLAWSVNGCRIYRPVLTTRLELIFDAKMGVFKLLPTSDGTILELDMLSNFDLPNSAHLISMERRIQEAGLDCWDDAVVRHFLEELAHTLSPQGNTIAEFTSGRGLKVEQNPLIYHAPVLFLRNRSGRQWHTELQSIMDEIRRGRDVPATIKALVSTEVSEEQESVHKEWSAVGERLLFPLPANDDQKEIARRLSHNIGVVVQGPPGTGKSHTIVNLIAHLLAHGKRVLVTSYAERALRVLGEMIRAKLPQIAPLCVNVIGGDARSIHELDLAVSKISEGLDTYSVEKLINEIDYLRQDMAECQRKIARLKTKLGRANEAENIVVSFDERDFTPIQLAEWLADHEEQGWLPDAIDATNMIPLTDAEMIHLYKLLTDISLADVAGVLQYRPEAASLPTVEDVSDLQQQFHVLQSECARRDALLKGWEIGQQAESVLSAALDTTTRAVETLALLSESWLNSILDDITPGKQRAEYWQDLILDCRERIKDIRDKAGEVAEYMIDIPQHVDLRQLRNDAAILQAELCANRKPGLLFRMFSGKKTLYILEQITMNGSRVRTAADVGILLQYLAMTDAQKRLILKWNNSMKPVEGPLITDYNAKGVQEIEKYLKLVQLALNWKEHYLNELTKIAEYAKPCGIPQWTELSWLKHYLGGLQAYRETLKYRNLKNKRNAVLDLLRQGMNMRNAHASWENLHNAYQAGDSIAWQELLTEVRRLSSLEPEVHALRDLEERLSAQAPRWMAQIESEVRSDGAAEPPADWRQAWEWKRAEAWLAQHFSKVCLEELHQQLHDAKVEEKRLIHRLVAASTWLAQIRRTTDIQRRSLRSWVQTIRRIGKGTGKYAAKHRADAKKEMAVCRGAVPVWIMPLNRVIENFKPADEPFDVVIVDESSQCDLFALSALFRAKRAVIVGDDRQISPEGVGRDQTEVYNLIERYLVGVPQRERFTLQDSLYDMALRVFPGQQIMLKEHFRSAPEIIQFSNNLFYGGMIEPLKIPSTGRLTPIVTVRVADGYREELVAANIPEAEALAQKIVELCSKEEYANKSMGVISLLGREQANVIEQLLRERLGETEMVERRLICGDAYSFQGDERDVMFLSMVAAPNLRLGVLNKRSDEQRFNVAASRAREQMWLFHSLDLKHLNPGCMRFHLLDYCLDPCRIPVEMADADKILQDFGSSRFHKDVYQMIVARNYRAIPEYKVGTHPFRIDIVIEGSDSRLAVECDGDKWHGFDRWEADFERQMILERAGWTFWRIRGSSFYRNREKSLEPLWQLLDSMGIRPQSQ